VLGNIFATVGAQAAALAGRPAEATAYLKEVRNFVHALPDNRAQVVNLAVAEVQVLVEHGETGTAFDEAVERFTALRVAPRFLWSFQRPLWVYVAFGRIAQATAAPAELRAARLVAARRAVRELRGVVNGPVMRAFHAVAVAAVRQLAGDHRGALRLLARAEVRDGGLDLPLLAYEAARVRARAWHDLHRPDEVRRHASVALMLAQQYGWQVRARWITTEFGFAARDAPAGLATASRHSTKHVPGEASGGSVRVLQALRQLSVAASAVLDTDQLARVALDEIVRIFGAERAFLFLHDEDGALVPYVGRDDQQNDLLELVGYGSTLVQRVAAEERALVITGSEQGAVLGSQSTVVHGLRSIMVAPLLVRGRMLGVVYLDSRAAKGIFTDDDVDILAATTTSLAASLETTRAVAMERAMHAARRERDVAEALRAAMSDFTATLDPAEVGRRLADRIAATLPQSTVTLLRSPPDNTPDTFRALTVGPDGVDAGLVTLAPQVVAELTVPGGDTDRPAGVVPATATAWFAVPLSVRGERPGLVVAHRTGPDFTSTEMEVAAALAGQGAAALDNALLFHQVTEIAARDALTGLFNRRHFFEVGPDLLRGTGRTSGPCAVMVDIDHFKMINDRYGHGAGDDVIRDVAKRLAAAVREVDLVCRYGGEEFAVLLADISPDDARRVADRIHAAVGGEPIASREGDIQVTASVGLAGHDGEATLDQLLGAADQALYEAKRSGRNRVVAAGDLRTGDPGAARATGNTPAPARVSGRR
jgi:diguanylate cyclase (GGDEF)-like protein